MERAKHRHPRQWSFLRPSFLARSLKHYRPVRVIAVVIVIFVEEGNQARANFALYSVHFYLPFAPRLSASIKVDNRVRGARHRSSIVPVFGCPDRRARPTGEIVNAI